MKRRMKMNVLEIIVMLCILHTVSGLSVNVGSQWSSSGVLNGILTVHEDQLKVMCEVSFSEYSQAGQETSRALGHTLASSGIVPTLTISNSTWSERFPFNPDSWMSELGYWTMNLTLDSFSPLGSVNIGEWYGTVEMDVNTGLLRKVVSIMDPNREPMSEVYLGPPVDSSYIPLIKESMTELISSQSPCSPDVIVLAALSNEDIGVFVGLTYEGLRSGTTQWYNLTSLLCVDSTSCEIGILVDLKLTSEYLVLLTTMTAFTIGMNTADNQSVVYRTNAHSIIGDVHLDDCILDYTPSCNSEKLMDEVVLLMQKAHPPHGKPRIIAVSSYPFLDWQPTKLTNAVPLLGVQLPQSARFLVLSEQHGEHVVSLFPQAHFCNSSVRELKPLYPPTSISEEFEPHGACIETVGYNIFLYGNEIWRSYDTVSFHQLVILPEGDLVMTCATSIIHHTSVFLTNSGNMYISKTAIPDRVVKAPQAIEVHDPFITFIDHVGDVIIGGINDEEEEEEGEEGTLSTWIQTVDITRQIMKAYDTVESPITIQHITASRFILQEGHAEVEEAKEEGGGHGHGGGGGGGGGHGDEDEEEEEEGDHHGEEEEEEEGGEEEHHGEEEEEAVEEEDHHGEEEEEEEEAVVEEDHHGEEEEEVVVVEEEEHHGEEEEEVVVVEEEEHHGEEEEEAVVVEEEEHHGEEEEEAVVEEEEHHGEEEEEAVVEEEEHHGEEEEEAVVEEEEHHGEEEEEAVVEEEEHHGEEEEEAVVEEEEHHGEEEEEEEEEEDHHGEEEEEEEEEEDHHGEEEEEEEEEEDHHGDEDEEEGEEEEHHEEDGILKRNTVGQELVGRGMRLLITNLKSLGSGLHVAMATSQEPSLHANMKTAIVTKSQGDMRLQEAPCQHDMSVDPKAAKQPTRYMDIGDSLTFFVSASYIGPIAVRQVTEALLSVRLTNPSLISVKIKKNYNRYGTETLFITVTHGQRNPGVTSVVVSVPTASMRCHGLSFTLTLHCTCPPTKRLHFIYDPPVTPEEYLHGMPKNRKNQSLLTYLAVNYRPPSKQGISVPLTDNIYNADPSKPKHHDHYQSSKDSGTYKQCLGKASREECGCTDEMRLSSLMLYTDCRERVYRISFTEKVHPHLLIKERGKEDRVLSAPYILTVTELNQRTDFVIEATPIPYLAEISEVTGIESNLLFSPEKLVIKFLATQLYHFRLSIIEGFSYCTLEDEFQMFIDRAPLPGLSQMIIFATVTILMGGVVFIIYLNYIRKTHIPDSHRTRSMMELYKM